MKVIADFHIHSRFSRATSSSITPEELAKWGKYKGIRVIGTGDFTHPLWISELQEKLEPAASGLYKLKDSSLSIYFVLSAEVATIYSQGGKTRRIHTVILAPNFKAVEGINEQLRKVGNLSSDGRPILGISAKQLAKIVLDVDPMCLVIPAHIWTPWFSVFGAMSGFDSLEECYEELTPFIYAYETGLSSDPKMCYQVSQLDNLTLLSNSDAHSVGKLGREATVFELQKLSFPILYDAIKNHDSEKIPYTLEFFPEEGKYFYDGSRNCGISMHPLEAMKVNNRCPDCNKALTPGVLHRVIELGDRSRTESSDSLAKKARYIVPLTMIIAQAEGISESSVKVKNKYLEIVQNVGSEFDVLSDISLSELKEKLDSKLVEGIERVRSGRVYVEPGYDGVFGKVEVFSERRRVEDSKNQVTQTELL